MDNKNKMKNYSLEKPFSWLYLLFALEILAVGYVFFFCDGYKFFQEDKLGMSILLPLGLLTFISIFISLVFPSQSNFLKCFDEIIQKHEKKLKEEFKEKTEKDINPEFLRDYAGRYEAITDYHKKVNPLKWLYISIFLFLFAILSSLGRVPYKSLLISIFIHMGIITTLFLITSIVSVIIAYNIENSKKDLISRDLKQ